MVARRAGEERQLLTPRPPQLERRRHFWSMFTLHRKGIGLLAAA